MASVQHPSYRDPLQIFLDGYSERRDLTPVPLSSTYFDVWIRGGLIVVKTYRHFQNVEKVAIEAALTFPIPVSATLFSLEANVAGRKLIAQSRKHEEARAQYEDAVCDGHLAVLHEELLRGIHMLSVANLAPGSEVEVINSWAAPLTLLEGRGQFRIPLTVGEMYGRSGLSDADDMRTGGAPQIGRVRLVNSDATVTANGIELTDKAISISLSRPIDIQTSSWPQIPVLGRAHNGQVVSVEITPAANGDNGLNLALLVDHSLSMTAPSGLDEGNGERHTNYDVAVNAVTSLDKIIESNDFVDLWEFDDEPSHVGSVGSAPLDEKSHLRTSKRLGYLAGKLSEPRGGTEIGKALEAVIAHSPAKDILLLTDGQSYALDVQALSQAGKRISVVLLGENSLEANVGHLAAITGGSIFIATPQDVEECIAAAVLQMRTKSCTAEGSESNHVTIRNGAQIKVARGPFKEGEVQEDISRAVAAVAASLTMPALKSEAAADLAVAECLVTSLTSLVLVDDSATVSESMPKFRKILLPNPHMRAPGAPMGRYLAQPNHHQPNAVAMITRDDETAWQRFLRWLLSGRNLLRPLKKALWRILRLLGAA